MTDSIRPVEIGGIPCFPPLDANENEQKLRRAAMDYAQTIVLANNLSTFQPELLNTPAILLLLREAANRLKAAALAMQNREPTKLGIVG